MCNLYLGISHPAGTTPEKANKGWERIHQIQIAKIDDISSSFLLFHQCALLFARMLQKLTIRSWNCPWMSPTTVTWIKLPKSPHQKLPTEFAYSKCIQMHTYRCWNRRYIWFISKNFFGFLAQLLHILLGQDLEIGPIFRPLKTKSTDQCKFEETTSEGIQNWDVIARCFKYLSFYDKHILLTEAVWFAFRGVPQSSRLFDSYLFD